MKIYELLKAPNPDFLVPFLGHAGLSWVNIFFGAIFLVGLIIGAATLLDSARAASQNGFCSYKLPIHKKTNIMQIMLKIIKFFY